MCCLRLHASIKGISNKPHKRAPEVCLDFSTCICDYCTPYCHYPINRPVVGSFDLDLMWCTNISTFIDKSPSHKVGSSLPMHTPL